MTLTIYDRIMKTVYTYYTITTTLYDINNIGAFSKVSSKL